MLKDLSDKNKELEQLKKKRKLFGNLYIQHCFDRKRPTIKIYDSTSHIELNEDEIKNLLAYLSR